MLVSVDSSLELGLIQFHLVSERAVASLVESFLHKLINDSSNLSGVGVDADNVAVIDHELLISLLLSSPEGLDLVDFAQLSDNLEEFISSASFLWLEERKPENNGVIVLEFSNDFSGQVVVDDVFEIN